MVYRFLGQEVNVEYCAYQNTSHAALFGESTGFDVLQYFIDNVGIENLTDPTIKVFEYSGSGDVPFALGMRTINGYWHCFYALTSPDTGYLDPDNLSLPESGYNSTWNRVSSTYDMSYDGIADLSNITEDDHAANTFYIYKLNYSYYPFWSLDDYSSQHANLANQKISPDADFIILHPLKNSPPFVNLDGSLYFTGATPCMEASGGWVNAESSDVIFYEMTQPSYNLNWAVFPAYLGTYNIFAINGVSEWDNFTDDTSTTGGISGNFQPYDGSVREWGLPGLSACDCGLITMYSPTLAQMQSFGNYLWTSNLIDNIKKLLADPLDNIINFAILPINLSGIKGSPRNVFLGNVDTLVSMDPLTTQYIDVDMGTVDVYERWGGALDYPPYQKCSLFLPFCGVVQISVEDVMNSYVHIFYKIDLLSGDCIAGVECSRKKGSEKTNVLYHHHGNCLLNVPITGKNYGTFYANLMQAGGHALAQMPSLGAGGGALGLGAGLVESATSLSLAAPAVERSGSYTGAAGVIGCLTPYFIFTQPKQQLPPNYAKYVGYPSYITKKLAYLIDYTMVEEVIDNTVSGATDTERAEIEKLLKEGIILPNTPREEE